MALIMPGFSVQVRAGPPNFALNPHRDAAQRAATCVKEPSTGKSPIILDGGNGNSKSFCDLLIIHAGKITPSFRNGRAEQRWSVFNKNWSCCRSDARRSSHGVLEPRGRRHNRD